MTQHSKFLSLVLRHKPDTIGLVLDSAGWVSVDALLQALERHGRPLSREALDEIVAANQKKRFAFSPDGRMIRASQGHSVEIDLGLEPHEPPPVLYHGTVVAVLPAILAEGLTRQQRRHVHLSADIETARQVGSRRGKAIILEIDTQGMHKAGLLFYRSANGVWLTDAVPPAFLKQL